MQLARSTRLLGFAAATAALLGATPALAAGPDWSSVAEVETIYVLTTDADGDTRDTKIWMVVLDDAGYIRTSQKSTWGANAERDPDIGLRIEEVEYPVRATFITDEAERARIVDAFAEKYGNNPIINWIRGDDPRIMRVAPR